MGTIAPWFGSNRMLAAEVGREVGAAEWCGVVFAGGMSEIRYITARTMVVNDLHRDIINLAGIVADPKLGPRLYRRLRRVLFHPDTLAVMQARCALVAMEADDDSGLFPLGQCLDMLKPENKLDWAEAYFVCAWMGRSGQAGTDGELRGAPAIRWEAGGGDSAVRFRSAITGLIEWRKTLARATFTTLDFRDFLTKCKERKGHAIYCDPPFPDAGDGYKHKFTTEMQRELASRLMQYGDTRVVCRFYDHPLVRELYPESHWTWRHLSGGKKQTNDAAPEVLILNGPSYPEPA